MSQSCVATGCTNIITHALNYNYWPSSLGPNAAIAETGRTAAAGKFQIATTVGRTSGTGTTTTNVYVTILDTETGEIVSQLDFPEEAYIDQ